LFDRLKNFLWEIATTVRLRTNAWCEAVRDWVIFCRRERQVSKELDYVDFN
jgi:hypothetical protein